jgi:esterase/lipase
MPDPSNASKQRWNAAHYTQVKASVDPAIAAAFKDACAASGVSMAGVLSNFMAGYSRMAEKNRTPAEPLSKRKQRRAAVKDIIAQMEQMVAAEERYLDSVPENLHGSKWHEAAEASISAMQEIIDLLGEVY